MTRFIVYLFETGLCLSLLYLAYWLFLRKETYFGFNRLFLTGSIVLALSVPLIHLNFIIPQGSSLKDPALGIIKFRNYYEELILMSNADFGAEPGKQYGMYDRSTDVESSGMDEAFTGGEGNGLYPASTEIIEPFQEEPGAGFRISVAAIIIIIYITGVIYFFIRFIYLVIRLFLLAKRHGVTRQKGFRMVEISEEISPFSFFRFLFINNKSFNESEFQNVLEHEKAHIRQKHSLDHLFAHGIAVFQWFNPFAWQIRNALKTTHEYIADRQVLQRGFEPFDYQSLLLKQVIGYHSVELVNNFNLKPIKKRIAMMTKTRSGVPAKLKAMLVIPFAIIVFLLSADFTLKGTGGKLLDQGAMTGLWERYKGIPGGEVHNAMGLLYISEDKFSYLEGIGEVREYFWRLDGENLILSTRKDAPGIDLKIKYEGEDLTIWWNDSRYHTYRKTSAGNTLERALSKMEVKIQPPEISQYRIMDRKLVYYIGLGYGEDGNVGLLFNGQQVELDDLPGKIKEFRSDFSKLDLPKLTAMFLVDKDVPMSEVVRVKEVLRKINALKIADAGYPHGSVHTISPLLYHIVALPRLLPPMDAKIMEKEEVEKQGIKLFVIDLSARNTTPADIDKGLEQFIRENDGGKYVFSLEYDGDIPYGQYIETVDMVFKVVYRFRRELAMRRFQVPYDQLGDELQKDIRRAYPMMLSEAWSGK
jgi:hypothetical protein